MLLCGILKRLQMVKNISILLFTSLIFSGCFWDEKVSVPKPRGIDYCYTNHCIDDSDFRYHYNDFDRY